MFLFVVSLQKWLTHFLLVPLLIGHLCILGHLTLRSQFFLHFFRLVPTVDLMELMTGRNLNGWTNSQSKLIKWYLHVTGVFIFLKNFPPIFTILRECSRKMKRNIGLRRIITAFDRATNLTFSCCVYKEKIVKKRLMLIQIEKIATFNSDRKKINLIPKKSYRYYHQ